MAFPAVHYKKVKDSHGKFSSYEKVLFFKSCDLAYFAEHYALLSLFNADDPGFPGSCTKTKDRWPSEALRKKYSVRQWARDSNFREMVLAAYGHQCAICRCKTEVVLQAAHEHGYEVAHTNCDDPVHGICLCANHHLMYDKNLVDIHLQEGTVTCKDDSLLQEHWYQEFQNVYHGKIINRYER